MFYNTIKQSGQLLLNFREHAAKQNDIVLYVFQKQQKPLTPFDVYKHLEKKGYNWPITSIRRAITSLTDDGKLRKLEVLKNEMYGKPNHQWEII